MPNHVFPVTDRLHSTDHPTGPAATRKPSARPHARRAFGTLAIVAATLVTGACATRQDQAPAASASPVPTSVAATTPDQAAEPPPAIRAWMDRLTVRHAYDPSTGFIVAKETISLPPLIADAPPLDVAIAQAAQAANSPDGRPRVVIAFATADRCAPCQQFKRDALNDPRVIARLAQVPFIPTHVEVDRTPQLADTYLGGRGIPMTYALRDGTVVATLRGQRSADDLLAWLDQVGS